MFGASTEEKKELGEQTIIYLYVLFDMIGARVSSGCSTWPSHDKSCWMSVEQQNAQGSCLPHLKLTFVIHRGASAAGT